MRQYAYATFLALPLLGLAVQTAEAGYNCCGYQPEPYSFVTKHFYVVKPAVIYGCDGYHCETNIELEGDIHIKARCRNGWCEIRSFPFRNAWVLESYLKPAYHHDTGYPEHSRGHNGYPDPGSDHLDGPDDSYPDAEPDYRRRY